MEIILEISVRSAVPWISLAALVAECLCAAHTFQYRKLVISVSVLILDTVLDTLCSLVLFILSQSVLHDFDTLRTLINVRFLVHSQIRDPALDIVSIRVRSHGTAGCLLCRHRLVLTRVSHRLALIGRNRTAVKYDIAVLRAWMW